MNKDRIYTDYLEDILDALRKSQEFTEGMSFEDFDERKNEQITEDDVTTNAVSAWKWTLHLQAEHMKMTSVGTGRMFPFIRVWCIV